MSTVRRRPGALAVALAPLAYSLIAAGSVGAANSTVDWEYDPHSGELTTAPQCHDANALVLTVTDTNMGSGGSLNASAAFNGSFIDLYGFRYDKGTAALLVVDGNYSGAVHIDESIAGNTNGESSNDCVLLASFTGLNETETHTFQVILQGAPEAGTSFTVANVVTAANGAHASSTSTMSNHSPSIIAIIVPIVLVILFVLGGVVLFLIRRKRIRDAKKAPSAAFRAEHPGPPMAMGTTMPASAVNSQLLRMPSTMSGAGSSSSNTLASVSMNYDDEKRRLKEIMHGTGQPQTVWDIEHGRHPRDDYTQ